MANFDQNIAIINGPNLNLLGLREPQIYGGASLDMLETRLKELGNSLNVGVTCFQSNCEGKLIDFIHSLRSNCDAIIINAGGLTHTSIVIRDALLGVEIPVWEVHISNVHSRDKFRHHSMICDIAVGVIVGLGIRGYEFALQHAVETISKN